MAGDSAVVIFVAALAALAALSGLASVVYALRNWRRGHASATWTTTQGTVLSSAPVLKYRDREDGDMYEPEVEYENTVDGRRFTSKRIVFGSYAGRDQNKVARIVKQYVPGTTVPVYYDPADPQSAVLEAKAAGLNLIWLIVGILTFAVGGFLLSIVGAWS